MRRCASSMSSSTASRWRVALRAAPLRIVVLSDHGQTQGATFKQRHGYGLDGAVERSLSPAASPASRAARAARDGPARRQRGDRQEGEAEAQERRLGARRRRPGLGQPRARLSDGARPPAHRRGDRRAPSRSHPDPAHTPTSAGARPLGRTRRGRSRPHGVSYLDEGRVEGAHPLAHFAHRRAICCAPTASARRRHHGRQLLRPHARRRLRLRGAHLVPRRPGRPADARLHPRPGAATRQADPGAAAVHGVLGLAPDAQGTPAGPPPAGAPRGGCAPSSR